MASCPFLESAGPLAFAHRGGAAEAPENSWAAFEHAAALGFRYMETDVRASADGVAVAFHDATVGRVTNGRGLVRAMDWHRLSALTLEDGSHIPRLDELLASHPGLRWNLDVKERSAVGPVARALDKTASGGRALIAASSERRSRAVSTALGSYVARGAGTWTVAALVVAKYLPTLKLHPEVVAAQVPPSRNGARILDDRFISACHRAGLAVHVWTVNDAADMDRWLDLGVDGVMTDRPSMLRDVLVRRGQWPGGQT